MGLETNEIKCLLKSKMYSVKNENDERIELAVDQGRNRDRAFDSAAQKCREC